MPGGESKYESDNEFDSWTIVNKTIEYMATSDWTDTVDKFFRQHCHKFEDAAECKSEEDIEHKLE